MNSELTLTAEIPDAAETDEHSWIPDLEISVSSVRLVVEVFARRQSPAAMNEEAERV
jgi:hypothetical protein